MRLKKLGAALVVVAALGVIVASSASAAATTTATKWLTGAAPTELTGSETMSSAIVGTEMKLATTVLGSPVVLRSTGINCKNCKIENSGGSAVGSGELEFTGVSVTEPAKCTVPSTITTKPLSITADWMIGETAYIKFVPTAVEGTFATVEFTGASCALAEVELPFKGSVFVEAASKTAASALVQEVHSSSSINSTAGGSLKAGSSAASLEGSARFRLTGTHAGEGFQIGGTAVEPLPNQTMITDPFGVKAIGGKAVPVINWAFETPIDTKGCKGGKVTVVVEAENEVTHKIEHREATLTEVESGKFSGKIPIMHPLHGSATLKIVISGCEHASEEGVIEFTCYIDPSGKVVDGNHENAPLWEATVTLLSSPTESGTYTAVENESTVMSPANRVNPDKSRENGGFGWDVIEGYYKVEATKAGCGTATTAAFHVPPPQESLEIVLHCEGEQWKLGEQAGEIAQLAITAPAKKCEGKIRVENVSFGPAAIRVLKETGIECTLKKACESKSLAKGEKCETELEKPGTKPEYELEVEWNGKKFTKKFTA